MNDIKLALLGSEGAGKSGEYSSYTLCSLYSLYAYICLSDYLKLYSISLTHAPVAWSSHFELEIIHVSAVQ